MTISVAAARACISEQLATLPPVLVELRQAAGRVLASSYLAPFDAPRFDNAAMDGYAVRSVDLHGASVEQPGTLAVAGIQAAGGAPVAPIVAGRCVQIMTGAPLPEGADAVVPVEDSGGYVDVGGQAQLHIAPRPGHHVRRRGEELAAGALLVGVGARIGPTELATLLTFGYAQVSVCRRPRLALLATGDELREPGEALGDGEVYNSNLYLLAELAQRAGAEVVLCERVRDEREALDDALGRARAGSDVVVTSGGVSMGRHDHVRDAAVATGFVERFWRVAQKPGGPLLFSSTERSPRVLLFGLPGNPISSYIGFLEYVWPALLGLCGKSMPPLLQATLTAPMPREKRKQRFMFGRCAIDAQGQLVAQPSPRRGSNMISAALGCNCILHADPGDKPLGPGEHVSLRLIPWEAVSCETNA